jgi:hypothetical protein
VGDRQKETEYKERKTRKKQSDNKDDSLYAGRMYPNT